MRFHLLGLSHLPTRRDISCCAYTQKVVKLARILKMYNHTVYFYGVEGSQVECDKMFNVVPDYIWRKSYPTNTDMRNGFFDINQDTDATRVFIANSIAAINAVKQEGDILLCPFGCYDKEIADGTGLKAVEMGIGYTGIFAKYKVFESAAWKNYVYGCYEGKYTETYPYDTVIPNYWDVNDFTFNDKKDDYFLYFGRLIYNKGPIVAYNTAKALNKKIMFVGQGGIKGLKDCGVDINDPLVIYHEAVGPEERDRIMGHAKVMFTPTLYFEPFGGVAVEAQLTGTPVIGSNWGGFTENIKDGVSGYLCNTQADFIEAAKNIDKIDPKNCRKFAEENFSLQAIGKKYEKYWETVAKS